MWSITSLRDRVMVDENWCCREKERGWMNGVQGEVKVGGRNALNWTWKWPFITLSVHIKALRGWQMNTAHCHCCTAWEPNRLWNYDTFRIVTFSKRKVQLLSWRFIDWTKVHSVTQFLKCLAFTKCWLVHSRDGAQTFATNMPSPFILTSYKYLHIWHDSASLWLSGDPFSLHVVVLKTTLCSMSGCLLINSKRSFVCAPKSEERRLRLVCTTYYCDTRGQMNSAGGTRLGESSLP